MAGDGGGSLEGLRVIEIGSLLAAPLIGTLMADHGADVIKVEHPSGDALRSWGWLKDGVSLWWLLAGRNKRCVTLDISTARGREILCGLLAEADVLLENFRPGTLERWSLGPQRLHAINPGLVIVRASGFGQTGPYRNRAGYGTLAEAMSGFAHITGWPDGPPTLPGFPLADAVAALTGTFAAMFALWRRDRGGEGRGQVIDLSIYEPLFWIMGPQALVYDQLGEVPGRHGNRTTFTAPRNTYVARDGRWLALSASSQSVAERVARLVGREDLLAEPWFADNAGRLAHAEELDQAIQSWIGERTAEEVIGAFAVSGAAIAPIYSVADIFEDEQYADRETIAHVEHPQLGPIRMQNVIPRFADTPGRIRHPGPELGAHNREVFGERLGISDAELVELSAAGVI
jgi:crotonobetainyl-CoA:carnitine CoA-transferase CaiB-like acyl-CoA transferase